MTHRLSDLQTIRYNEVMLIVTAILSAGKLARGEGAGDSIQKQLKMYTDLLFPLEATDDGAAAALRAKLLKQEFERGPMKVESREYAKKRKRKAP